MCCFLHRQVFCALFGGMAFGPRQLDQGIPTAEATPWTRRVHADLLEAAEQVEQGWVLREVASDLRVLYLGGSIVSDFLGTDMAEIRARHVMAAIPPPGLEPTVAVAPPPGGGAPSFVCAIVVEGNACGCGFFARRIC